MLTVSCDSAAPVLAHVGGRHSSESDVMSNTRSRARYLVLVQHADLKTAVSQNVLNVL